MQKKRTRDAFTHGKMSSKSQLIYLKILKHGERCGWYFLSKPKEKNIRLRQFEDKSQKKKNHLLEVFTGSTALLIHLEVQIPEERYK